MKLWDKMKVAKEAAKIGVGGVTIDIIAINWSLVGNNVK